MSVSETIERSGFSSSSRFAPDILVLSSFDNFFLPCLPCHSTTLVYNRQILYSGPAAVLALLFALAVRVVLNTVLARVEAGEPPAHRAFSIMILSNRRLANTIERLDDQIELEMEQSADACKISAVPA